MPHPSDRATLFRRYQRLLVTYPSDYRGIRGEEIAYTMLESAPAHRTRPSLREAGNLLGSGLRCRLGRPANRWIVLLSLLAALMTAVLGAIVASGLIWQTAAPLPDDNVAHQIFRTAIPERVHDSSGWRQGRDTIDGPAKVSLDAFRPATMSVPEYATASLNRLRAAGWQVSSPTITWNNACFGGWWGTSCNPRDVNERVAFTARKARYVVQLTVARRRPPSQKTVSTPTDWIQSPDGTQLDLTLDIFRSTPSLAIPVELASGAICGVIGWLLFGRISRRGERLAPAPRRVAQVLYAALGLFWLLPGMLATLGIAFMTINEVISRLGLFQRNDRWIPDDLNVYLEPPLVGYVLLGALPAAALILLSVVPGRRWRGQPFNTSMT